MYKGRRILAIVPARGGSKGISLKNLRLIGGTSMVGLAGKVACQVNLVDRSVASTDHEEIAREAQAYGLDAPFRRPAALSGDRISDIDVLMHGLKASEVDDGTTYHIVVMLQPTSPLRKAEHVVAVIEKLVDDDLDAVWTVSKTDSKAHPLKQLTLTNDRLDYYLADGARIIARQDLATVYHRNGIAYAFTRSCLLDYKTMLTPRTGAVILDGHFVSIDTEWDIELVEYIRARQN